jgi:methyl-accepting chemotaxis protein
MSIRLKTIMVISVASIAGTSFLWNFNIFYVVRNWSLYWDGFSVFFGIALSLILLADIVVFLVFRPVAAAEKRHNAGRKLTEAEDESFEKSVGKMPLIVSMVNIFGFFLGPLSKRIISTLVMGENPLSIGLLTSVIFSVAIGVYIAFIEIRMIEGYLTPLQLNRDRRSIDGLKKKRWSGSQFLLGFTLFFLAFGLFFSAGKGYLTEELLAPSRVDVVSSASETTDIRSELWSRALSGEKVELDEMHPDVSGRLWEYVFKMGLLGFIIMLLSWFAIKIESGFTGKRVDELNDRLKDLTGGKADKGKKLVIIRPDEFGETIHWINKFIDRQASLMSTVSQSIESIGKTSEELGEMNNTAQELGSGIEAGISSVKQNLVIQNDALAGVEQNVSSLGESIVRTNDNLLNQKEAMSNNSASMEEMAASIGSVSRNSEGVFENTQVLIRDAEQSGSDMEHLLGGINDIAAKAEEVSKSVGQIGKIAAQTNLLSMNAAIEAAHAGDSGSGFAVVASEVRKLAEDSSLTAKSISSLIKDMNASSGSGLAQAHKAKNSFTEIQNRVKQNSILVSEISQSMKEQEAGSLEIQSSLQQLEELTNDVAEIAQIQNNQRTHVGSSMNQLSAAADAIQDQMDNIVKLMTEFDSFILSLGEIIERNSSLVIGLKEASRTGEEK